MFSWLVAMTITALLCWLFLKPDLKEEADKESLYKRLVSWTVDNPAKALTALIPPCCRNSDCDSVGGCELYSPIRQTHYFLGLLLPNGAKIERTADDLKRVEQWLIAQPEVESFSTSIGASVPRFSVTVEPEPLDSAYGQILINTVDFHSINGLIARGDKWLAQNFPDAEPRFRNLKLATADKFSVEARFSGPDETVLHDLANQAKAIFATHPDAKYIRDDWRQPSKMLKPIINQQRAREAGINAPISPLP